MERASPRNATSLNGRRNEHLAWRAPSDSIFKLSTSHHISLIALDLSLSYVCAFAPLRSSGFAMYSQLPKLAQSFSASRVGPFSSELASSFRPSG